MNLRINKTLKSLFLPGGVLLIVVAALAYAGWFPLALPSLRFLYYCATAGGMLLAWRFHSSRVFLALLAMFLATEGVALLSGGKANLVLAVVRTAAILVPVDFVLIALMQESGFTVASMAPVTLFLFVQSGMVFVFSRALQGAPSAAAAKHLAASISFPNYTLFILAGIGIFLLIRFISTRKPLDGALLWSLGAFFLCLRFTPNPRLSTLYAATAASILAVSIIENSYLLAYQDELTSLPSRRAFNDELLRLQDPYSIAMVDIDNFKKFNDTYGHDTGDEVLRLVATKLARVSGGGRAYRCGGEEFTIVFPGKSTSEVVDHLEQLRNTVENSAFHMRGTDRRQAPRGPERRTERARSRAGKAQAIRKMVQEKPSSLSVTVSIGVASSGKKDSDPDSVLKSADKALYRAKANGRNRVEIASSPKAPARAAGIA